ncbi:hypothetical protein [Anaerocolumna aminovalerica]|uniref:hypothetical protein n=1 Tax=Anaerocolumna aminovalerica TaxID=1527 RepID=UPI0011144255|nr:hypothetical protein [Anaerocolumna aminovalerica]
MWLDITSSAGFDKANICLTGHYMLLLFELLVSSEDFTHLLNYLTEHTSLVIWSLVYHSQTFTAWHSSLC